MSTVKRTDPIEYITTFPNLHALPRTDRAVIYAMAWCNSDSAKQSTYAFSEVMDIANEIKKFI